jgi:hypothetical protein
LLPPAQSPEKADFNITIYKTMANRGGRNGRGNGRGSEHGRGGRGGGAPPAWPVHELPPLNNPVTEFYAPLRANRAQLLIRRCDAGLYSIVPHTLDDWRTTDPTVMSNAYWVSLNNKLGNVDRTLVSVRAALSTMDFSDNEIDFLDMKNVPMVNGVVANNCPALVWNAFNTNLEGGMTLKNSTALCSKLKYMCGETTNDTVHVLTKGPQFDLVGGKVKFSEYLVYIDDVTDTMPLFKSFLREMFEELNLTSVNELAEPFLQSNGLFLSTERFNCTRQNAAHEPLVSLEIIQVAAFFVKIVVHDVIIH